MIIYVCTMVALFLISVLSTVIRLQKGNVKQVDTKPSHLLIPLIFIAWGVVLLTRHYSA